MCIYILYPWCRLHFTSTILGVEYIGNIDPCRLLEQDDEQTDNKTNSENNLNATE